MDFEKNKELNREQKGKEKRLILVLKREREKELNEKKGCAMSFERLV